MHAPVKVVVLGGARPLSAPSQGLRRRRGYAVPRSVQWKEVGEVMIDLMAWCLAQGLCSFAKPHLLGLR
jgi:hypothetical protein